MTRCYQYYCLVNRDIKHPVCSDKSPQSMRKICKYIEALKEHGVKLDGTETDKERFKHVREEVLGSERSFCQKKTRKTRKEYHDTTLIKEAMAYPIDELIEELNRMSKTTCEWFDRCSERSLFKLRKRVDKFLSTISELKQDLGIDDV